MKARVLTFNTLFRGQARARIGVLAGLIEQMDYDVVCLQEVISPRVLALLRRAVPSYPHAAHVPMVPLPLVRGGLVTLSRHPITRRHFQPFALARPARPEWLLGKGALFTRVRLPTGHLTVVNAHLSANMDMDWSPGNRYAKVEQSELRRLASAINRIDRAEPLVAMGDFNVPRDSPTSRSSCPPRDWRTLWRATRNRPTVPTTRTSAPSTSSSSGRGRTRRPAWSSRRRSSSPPAPRPSSPTTTA
ncbi:endonuclease/exonuclease/phosphatase family protein [Actinomadura madurae]|uniref:endonuclease/exonuclease/phosphatase family protein n=1 Tax=Actinomadura madurae TaxID=1993 RepID=UPI0020D21891|nr:endonuclease/exonuclease/phosphatase family protein [Actinomadura madurae]MCP9952409.1 endonuclease/exonuclease/phosphatase family protein [Actinomadura madurae]MCP9969169.1 endonuclease/exonuclease/phosphatase family protein [Actinomadura madurae]MCQ0017845.1 endonuclease/exonuclease/phosphatase family protein [Actinomadura madurae]